jgi:hypothetical protein
VTEIEPIAETIQIRPHNPRPLPRFAPPATNFASQSQKPLAKLGIGQDREEMVEMRGAALKPEPPLCRFQHLAGSDDFLTESWLKRLINS